MTEPERRARRVPRGSRVILPVLATALFVAILVVAVFPTRTYLSQRHTLTAAARQLNQLETSNKAMQAESKRLQTSSEIEEQARRDHDMVFPGEEVYQVLPAPQVPLAVPDVWPFNQLEQRLGR